MKKNLNEDNLNEGNLNEGNLNGNELLKGNLIFVDYLFPERLLKGKSSSPGIPQLQGVRAIFPWGMRGPGLISGKDSFGLRIMLINRLAPGDTIGHAFIAAVCHHQA